MKIYNSLTGKKEDFIPIQEGKVTMYVCGPTVYNYVHIGNMRPVITFDMIYNYLKYIGYEVKYASNFTDINEKISIAAKELGICEREVADKFVFCIKYIDKNGKTFTASSGDVVYVPIGSEYKAQLIDFESHNSHTIGINFLLFDDAGESVCLSNDILVFQANEKKILPMLFQKTLSANKVESLLKNRIVLMEILLSLSADAFEKPVSCYAEKALQYLSEHVEENPSICKLAKLCNISEVYFRKQFKAYVGVSPQEYRNGLRLSTACSYLEYGEISVQEISDTLGYSTVSHFIKEFKSRYGLSPLKYRKLNKIK